MDVIELLKQLVDIPSVTGSERSIADFIAGCFRREGLEVLDQPVEGTRRNVLALLGRGAGPRVVFCTHLDTVPPFIGATEDETFIHGRGAGDAKGSLAAMMACAGEMKEDGLAGAGFLFVVGEEVDSAGARKANELDLSPDFTVVGEPTENRLGFGHRGLLVARFSAAGRTAHSGYPHLGDSAIDKLLEALARLKPAFQENGIVTAGNAPGITDGAAALLVLGEDTAQQWGITPLARIVDYAQAGVEPLKLFTAPIFATRQLLDKVGWKLQDVDLIEINEAFASQTVADGKVLGVDWERVNVHGGAIALGHPIGASGARVLVTLIYALRARGLKRGLATLCLGGGEAVAMAIELV